MANVLWSFAICFASLLSASRARDLCEGVYCQYGCCDPDFSGDDHCCSEDEHYNMRIGTFVGIFGGGGATLFLLIIAILVCRRRGRNNGAFHRSPSGNPGLVHQDLNSSSTGYATSGMQPGIACPPPYQAHDTSQMMVLAPPYTPSDGSRDQGSGVLPLGPPSYDSLFASDQQQQQQQQQQAPPGTSSGLVNQSYADPDKISESDVVVNQGVNQDVNQSISGLHKP